jgi:hypothetical protein
MTGLLVCLWAAAMGIEYGWQPVAGGGIEYIIQIEPALLESLKSGRDVFSDLPSSVSNVRRYRITVGNERLPHHGEPLPATSVVQAGGQVQSGNAKRETPRDMKPSDIDVSELPGPVLSPALELETPANETHGDDEEPERLADSNRAQPMDQTASDFRQQREAANDKSMTHKADNDGLSASLKPDAQDEGEHAVESAETKKPPDQSPAKTEGLLANRSALLTQLGLLFSVGGNVFLLWVATDQRRRYRAIVRRIFEGTGASIGASYEVDFPRRESLPAPEQQSNHGTTLEDANNAE